MRHFLVIVLVIILVLNVLTVHLCIESNEPQYVTLQATDIFRLPDDNYDGLQEFNFKDDYTVEGVDSDFLMIYVSKSNIENGGDGLFAKKLIPKNAIICELRGPIVINSDISKLPYNDKIQSIQYMGKHYGIFVENVCAFINDCSNAIELLKQNNTLLHEMMDPSECYDGLSYNAVAVAAGPKALVVSTKDILPNEEIFFGYGWSYWQSQFTQTRNGDNKKPIIKKISR